jgi:sarcosine oxidase
VTSQYDIIVIGAGGAMGSSACWHLARSAHGPDRPLRILGLDQFAIGGHDRGSSHGHSRMIRLGYYEHPDYVPLLKRAFQLWRDLERDADLAEGDLLRITGGLYMGPGGCETVEGSRRAADLHGLPHELLSRADLARRFPQFQVGDDFEALFEPMAGYLIPERVIAANTRLALEHGVDLRGHEPVVSWRTDGDTAIVTTTRAEYRAAKLIFAAGAWATRIVTDLGVQVTATRQALGWVAPPASSAHKFAHGVLPVWAIDAAHVGEGLYYGFPTPPPDRRDEVPGFKLARHLPGEPTDPDRNDWSAWPTDEDTFRPALRRWLPEADGPTLAVRICMYENSPDKHFIIDRHPLWPNVIVACGFSGHGFKFASVVGEVLAQMTDGEPGPAFLGLSRFTRRSGSSSR